MASDDIIIGQVAWEDARERLFREEYRRRRRGEQGSVVKNCLIKKIKFRDKEFVCT